MELRTNITIACKRCQDLSSASIIWCRNSAQMARTYVSVGGGTVVKGEGTMICGIVGIQAGPPHAHGGHPASINSIAARREYRPVALLRLLGACGGIDGSG
jgi:hypothetical protein